MAKLKYDLGKIPDRKKLEKDLKGAIFETAKESISKRTFEASCPKCGAKIQVQKGLNICPACGNQINVTLKINM